MNFEQIIDTIKARKFFPIYFLFGEEGYFIDQISDLLEQTILTDEEKAFNQLVMYGRDVTVSDIISTAKRFPMMSPYQVLIVKEAQDISKIEEIELYLEQPMQTTILVFCYRKSLDKRRSYVKKLSKGSAILFESKKLYENQMPEWIKTQLGKAGYGIEPKATMLLVEFLGTNLSKVINELNKLQIVLPKGTMITPEHIERNIGISKDFNVFELQKALGNRDLVKIIQIVKYFESNPKDNPIQATIAMLFGYFSKIYLLHFLTKKQLPDSEIAKQLKIGIYFLKEYKETMKNFNLKQTVEAISLLRSYDLKSKGVGNISTSGGQLLQEMLYKILYTK